MRSRLAPYGLDALSWHAPASRPVAPSLASEPGWGYSLSQILPASSHPRTPTPTPTPTLSPWGALTLLSSALRRRAAVLSAAPSLWLPHPYRQLHRQPGPAAEDALQQVGRRSAACLGPRDPGGGREPAGARTSDAGSLDRGHAGSWRQRTLLVT